MRAIKIILVLALALVLAGFAVVLYRSHVRDSWKDAAVARVSANTKDPNWAPNLVRALNQAGPEDSETEGGWFKRDFVLLKNGEWMAYKNICRKEDWRIDDLFIGYGSDHQWYYSTFHFCIGAYAFRMYGQPESLAAMVKTYRLRPFNGKSDKSPERTWP